MIEDWPKLVALHFPAWVQQSVPERLFELEDLKLDTVVDGTVVAVAPFGVWLDIGRAYPGLLPVINFHDAQTRSYQLSEYRTPGTELRVRVVGINFEGQVYVTQRDRDREQLLDS